MTIDATGKDIVIGQRYGYSKSASGYTRVIIGTATKAEDGKVTLGEIEEKENIHEAIKKVSTEDLLKTCRFYLETKDLQEKTKVSNDIFDQFLEYFSNIEGHDGWSVRRHTYDFLLNAFFVRSLVFMAPI